MPTILPAFEDFQKNHVAGKSQLVWTWAPADLETPVSAYLKLTAHSRHPERSEGSFSTDEGASHSFLLESVEGGATLGRYSAIGLAPDLVWSYDKKDADDPVGTLRRMISESRIDVISPDMPPMAPSGLFGFLGYGMAGAVENIPDTNPDPIGIPDSMMIRPTVMVIFDNVQSRMCIATPVRVGGEAPRSAYDAAIARVEDILSRLNAPLDPSALASKTSLRTPLPVSSNLSEAVFHGMVDKAADYIRAGEIFQVVLGQRFSMPFDLPAFSLYRSLRRLNPSPFLFYFNLSGFQLVGSSPEILVRVRERKVTIRPIAGTRKRGKDAAEDASLAEDLLADPKERAEHLMLLDLGRNDVGRVAEIGSVKVTDSFAIERYSHVMHIVSNVEGTLRSDLDSLDALFSGFPAGTVTGAPKIRAMEIIDELEPLRRSFYAGCVGYLDGNGDVDTCIALRTALVKDGHIHVQASGGIVADSNAPFEYNESLIKARAIVAAAEEAVAFGAKTRRV